MKLLGIALKTPSFYEATAAAIFGIGLWIALLGMLSAAGKPLELRDAGAALVVFVWGAIGVRIGVDIGQGGRHLAANLIVSAALLLVYEAAWRIAS